MLFRRMPFQPSRTNDGIAGPSSGGESCSSAQNSASMSSSAWLKMTDQMFWQSSLHKTSLAPAVVVLLRIWSANFRLTAL
jgi:hypothetical protein